MPKTDEELAEILQVRVSTAGLAAIKKRAKAGGLSMAAYVRVLLYRDAGVIK